MAAGVDFLSAEMAHKVHIDAVNRDYICEPRLGASHSMCCLACPPCKAWFWSLTVGGAGCGAAGGASMLFCTLPSRI